MTTDGIEIERLAQGGDGVGHLPDGRVIFVPEAFPGERVEVEIVKQKKRWARGRLVSVVDPSPHRLDRPGCPHDGVCGGCTFRLLDYDEEFRAKVEAARDALQRIGKFDVPSGTSHPARSADGYRIRARLHVRRGKTGYFTGGSRDVFGLHECPALDARLQRILAGVVSALRVVQQAEVKIETADRDSAVVLVDSRYPVVDEVLDELNALDGVRGVRLDDPNGVRRRGDPTVSTLEALGLSSEVRMPPGLFRQSNAQMNDVLRQLVVRRTGSAERLVELFSGAGNFTFALVDAFARIDAYESSPRAVGLGNSIAESCDASHVRFHAMDLEREGPRGLEGATILLDPPRTGADAVVNHLGSRPVERIVYVSCDPATLARDLRTLVGFGWAVESVDFVDMFPRTPHLESVAVVQR